MNVTLVFLLGVFIFSDTFRYERNIEITGKLSPGQIVYIF